MKNKMILTAAVTALFIQAPSANAGLFGSIGDWFSGAAKDTGSWFEGAAKDTENFVTKDIPETFQGKNKVGKELEKFGKDFQKGIRMHDQWWEGKLDKNGNKISEGVFDKIGLGGLRTPTSVIDQAVTGGQGAGKKADPLGALKGVIGAGKEVKGVADKADGAISKGKKLKMKAGPHIPNFNKPN